MCNKELEAYINRVNEYYHQCAYNNQFEAAGMLREVLEFLKKWQKEEGITDDEQRNIS